MSKSKPRPSRHQVAKMRTEVEELIRTGRMPSLEQLQAAIAETRQKYRPQILAARKNRLGKEKMRARISQSELAAQIKSDAVLRYMVENNIPLTCAIYMSLAYLGDVPEPLGVEAELPSFLQDWRFRHAA